VRKSTLKCPQYFKGLYNYSVPVLRGTSNNPVPVKCIEQTKIAKLNLFQFNYSLTHNPENKPSSKYHHKIMVAFRPGDPMPCLRCPITGGAVRLSTQLPSLPPATKQTQKNPASLNQSQARMAKAS